MKTIRKNFASSYRCFSLLAVILSLSVPAAAASEKAPVIRLLMDNPSAAEAASAVESPASGLPEDLRQVPFEIKTGQSVEDVKYARIEVALETEKEEVSENGNRTAETFNAVGQRTEKRILDSAGNLLERWVFDPEKSGRILRYEIYVYGPDGLENYRVAEWEYEETGASMKTNRVYNARKEQTGVSVEYKAVNGNRFREEWYDAKENPVGLKLWDAETGAFQEHLLIKYAAGMKKVQWLDENGNKLREQIVRTLDDASYEGVRIGGSYETGVFENLRNRDRRARRPWVTLA